MSADRPGSPPPATAGLVDLLGRGGALILTGAGVSTDSGIPDYRDADGRARNPAPMTYQRFVGSEVERQRYWARSHIGWERIATARPNPSHVAVAQLQSAGLLRGVVTQNVDGLHSAAGSAEVIDLHGRLDTVVCLGCEARRPRLEHALRLDAVNPGFRAGTAARSVAARPDGDVVLAEEAVAGFRIVSCRQCGGILKPDVVFFGERVPRDRFERSFAMLDEATALVVLGSSLFVGSGYRLVTAARRRGLPVAIVTRGVSRADAHADVRIHDDLATVLSTVAEALTERLALMRSPSRSGMSTPRTAPDPAPPAPHR